jgi:hypothetical protein
MRTVFDLMRKLAPILAGRKVYFRLGDPPTKTGLGTTSVSREGVPVVIVRPDAPIETYLHELAHIRLGHTDKMTRSDTHKRPAYSVQVKPSQRVPTWENQADALSDQWLTYGKAHELPGYNGEAGVLMALLNYYKER